MEEPDKVEWIVVYDADEVDERILQYESSVPIKLVAHRRGLAYASDQRNRGMEMATGDWLYFLDDDNLAHPKLVNKVRYYGKGGKIVIFNQFSESKGRRINGFDIKKLRPAYIDTAQLVVPAKYKHVRWSNKREYPEEYDYLVDLIEEAGEENVVFVDRLVSYRNYLRRYEV